MANSSNVSIDQSSTPEIRKVSTGQPFVWLRAGLADLFETPIASIAYGLLFAIAGDIILIFSWRHPHLFTAAISGFLLLGPILAAGLYEISRRKEQGLTSTFVESLSGLQRNRESLAFFGLALAALGIAWERISAILFALLSGANATTATELLRQLIGDPQQWPFLALWLFIGALLALLVFALSVISVPLLLDRRIDTVSAILLSLKAFAGNYPVLLLWAALIVLLTLVGFASLLFGLIIIMPILGHASWHAYRDLVE
ncbi:MAG: DUF2189 domain-containing protein [Zoogloeaceae bacterium]|nr:DUF2189 domain-containing protein [Zoogloeaceae bacterium]